MDVVSMDKKELFLEQFRVSEGVHGVSKSAELALLELPFPNTREEYWKYTRLTKIQNGNFLLDENPSFEPILTEFGDAFTFNCVNGFFEDSDVKLPIGVQSKVIEEIRDPLVEYQYEFFSALNTAYFTSGIRIKLEPKMKLDKPILINFVSTGNAIQAQPRLEIVLGEGASAAVIINFQNQNATEHITNVVSEMKVSKNASLQVHQLQQSGDDNYLINTTEVLQKRDSKFSIHTMSLEGKILRNNLNIAVDGQNCETRLNGVYLVSGTQHVDNHTYVDHKKPNCNSSENYKGIIDDKATAVFNGKVMVQPDAQKINAFQSNQNILLSDDATINSKPELEIYADDVQCSHGSTTGQLDEEALFYLRSRGVSEKSAKKMLIRAFVFDVLEEIELEVFKYHVEGLVEEKFGV
ncbi:MAG: Fe-S cluster assembly protein SufD [Flavobacteriales bacterium]|nr:Fe-S cluster assembly protein SufD [Flavobacteriales bacterium]